MTQKHDIMEFEEFAGAFRAAFDGQLRDFFDRVKPVDPLAQEPILAVWRIIRDFTLSGGKRLRPLLVCLSYQGYSGRNWRDILLPACSIELMQTYLLIHDDIMDRSDIRRGAPTAHRRFEQQYRDASVPDLSHFGMSMAILAGNVAMTYGARAIASAVLGMAEKTKALNLYLSIAEDENMGQILDMNSESRPEIPEEEALLIYYYKTTRYTIEGPLHLGAALAAASDAELKLLSAFATPLGNAFQLQDDILGLYGDEKKLGKAVGSDIREGKKTLLITMALRLASESGRERIRRTLGRPDADEASIEEIRGIVEECGARAQAGALIHEWCGCAKKALASSRMAPDSRALLEAFADYLVTRET